MYRPCPAACSRTDPGLQRAAVSAWEPVSALFSLLLQPKTHASSRRLALAQVHPGCHASNRAGPECDAARLCWLAAVSLINLISWQVELRQSSNLCRRGLPPPPPPPPPHGVVQVLVLMEVAPAGEDDRLAKAALFTKYTGAPARPAGWLVGVGGSRPGGWVCGRAALLVLFTRPPLSG